MQLHLEKLQSESSCDRNRTLMKLAVVKSGWPSLNITDRPRFVLKESPPFLVIFVGFPGRSGFVKYITSDVWCWSQRAGSDFLNQGSGL